MHPIAAVCLLRLNVEFDIYKPQVNFFAIRRLHFFCSFHPTIKISEKTSLDLSSFLSFHFDGKPIKFHIHSCRGIIVEKNV